MGTASLTLTREELIVFLAILGVETMNGLPLEPLRGLSDPEVKALLNNGEESLQKRGLITLRGEDEAIIDDALVALVGSAVLAEITFSLEWGGPGKDFQVHFFSATPELMVEHHSPRPHMYIFEHIPHYDVVQDKVQNLLAPLSAARPPATKMSQQIEPKRLAQVVESRLQMNFQAAQQELQQLGWPADMATFFPADYSTGNIWNAVVTWGVKGGKSKGENVVTVAMGNGRCWLMEDSGRDVKISAQSGLHCQAKLLTLLEPLKKTVVDPV